MISAGGGPRQGLVLSGGGATGAYGVGVVKALLSGRSPVTAGRPFVPEICAGTSIGSFSAAFLVSRLDELGPRAADALEAAWRHRLSGRGRGSFDNGFYRIRFDPSNYLSPSYYLSNPLRPALDAARDLAALLREGVPRFVHLFADWDEELRQRLSELIDLSVLVSLDPFVATIAELIDFPAIRRCGTLLRIPATNWTTGLLTVFTNPEMTDQTGPLAILASSAIPGLFPPVAIGAEPHADGGVLMNTPLRLVTRHADVLHVVYLDPDVRAIPDSHLANTVSSLYRQQLISWARTVNDDVDDARAINLALHYRERAERGESIDLPGMEDVLGGLSALFRRIEERRPPYRTLTIHRYHPRDDLTGGPLGLLRLERGHVESLIDRGFSDAAEHDCETSGCVLPEAEA